MGEIRSRLKRNYIVLPAAVFWHVMVLLFVCLIFGAGITVSAAENNPDQEPGSDIVMIRVEGQLEEIDRDELLERINAIRREACEEGIDNPVNGIPLTVADYVPLQWSYELEEIAMLRAAESTILQDHVRPDGRECFTAAPEGVSYTMETLAWGFGSASQAVEGWYSEKASYVESDGKPAGHYMALINPENRFVGIAHLKPQWQRDACAGAFGERGAAGEPVTAEDSAAGERDAAGESLSAESAAGEHDAAGEPAALEANSDGEAVWMIPVRAELLPSIIERALEITAGRIYRAAVSVMRHASE